MADTVVVFVHGFLSSVDAWSNFIRLVEQDESLPDVTVRPFSYDTRKTSLNPMRRIPGFDAIADSLRTFLTVDLARYRQIALVTHSQGGLIAQRALARMLTDDDDEMTRIRLLLMYACPNGGSDLAPTLRRIFFRRNPQERQLRPLVDAVVDAQRTVLNRIVHAADSPVQVRVYAGESDNVVPPASARSVFPLAGVLPGDHSTIIRPDSLQHRSYLVFRHALQSALSTGDARPVTEHHTPHEPVSRSTGPTPPSHQATPDASAPPPDRSIAAPVPRQAVANEEPTDEEYGNLVDLLLRVPGMRDRHFRQQLYARLPHRIQEQLPDLNSVRGELVGLVTTLWEYRHLHSWQALADALTFLVPDHPATTAVIIQLHQLDR
ncbi:alpha/beta fold hydrolase [Micromonospora ureilytica]|uniref:alpha/beta fold hydrolase n=1 Tax=Micromonospora ureilytica TaxID=709868 RepID=UPI0033CF4B2E